MGKKRSRYNGVFAAKGKLKTSYGIDYVHPQTGQRIRKIIKGCQSEAQAAEIRSIENADAARGVIKKAYGLRVSGQTVLFDDMVTLYLDTWAITNRDYRTAKHRAPVLRRAFTGNLMRDITPWVIEKFKASEAKEKSKNTVNKYLSLGSQIYEKAIEWGKYAVLAHNTLFDAAILSWRFGVKPAAWLDTLSMARAMFGMKGNSLALLAKRYGLEDKGNEVQNAMAAEPATPRIEAKQQVPAEPKTEQITKEEIEDFMRRYVNCVHKK